MTKSRKKSHTNNTEQLKTDTQRKLKYYYENDMSKNAKNTNLIGIQRR